MFVATIKLFYIIMISHNYKNKEEYNIKFNIIKLKKTSIRLLWKFVFLYIRNYFISDTKLIKLVSVNIYYHISVKNFFHNYILWAKIFLLLNFKQIHFRSFNNKVFEILFINNKHFCFRVRPFEKNKWTISIWKCTKFNKWVFIRQF